MKVALIFLSFVAISYAAAIDSEIQTYNIVDEIIKKILEKLRPKLVDPKIPDIDQKFKNEYLDAHVILKKISVKNLDKFVIQNLKSSAVPLKLTNITLTWKEISGNGYYDFNGSVNVPGFKFSGYGKGNGKLTLNNLFFTIGANLEMKDSVIQIKPRGLFGFDIRVGSSKVSLESVNGSEEQAKKLSETLSKAIPGLVNDLKKPIFEKYQDDIIKAVNKLLKQFQTYSDESVESAESLESEEM